MSEPGQLDPGQTTASFYEPPSQSASTATRKNSMSPDQKEDRKQRIQTHGRASMTRSIADAVVIKDGDLFFLCEPSGRVPLEGEHGFGLYYHDCRFLRGYEMKLAQTDLDLLAATAHRGFLSIVELTNPDITMPSGRLVRKEQLGVKWEHTLNNNEQRLEDVLTFQNYGVEPVEFPVSFSFQAEFEPLFVVRGLLDEKRGTVHPPCWREGQLCYFYEGADHLYRSLSVHFAPAPHATDGATAHFQLALQPQERLQLFLTLRIGEDEDRETASTAARQQPYLHSQLKTSLQDSSDQALVNATEIRSDSVLFNNILERSLRDLHMLKTTLQGHQFFAAGVPWFVTLFGRDSLIASLQMLAYDPKIAEQTLSLLAHYQGRKVDEWRDEQPGKIMHELRVGELAHLNEIPQTPYYGTIDATLLFLILLAQHATWTGTLTLFRDLRDHVEQALSWIAQYGDQNNDGYVAYQSTSKNGLINQGWKDSGDAIVNVDGSLATPPIALVEVQGYIYLAKQSVADLYERVGESKRAVQLRQEAQELRCRFNRDFWLPDQGFYALALQAQHRPAAVISSNPGQALWTGIVEPELARQTVSRLMADDMFSGWGVRTLSTKERRYNPIGYHLGTVWPHDNALIAAGFCRYGYRDAACRVLTGMIEAATHFAHHRLPEVFAGFSKQEYGVPVHYPVACHPQAWAAGSIPFLVATCLGLRPDAFMHRLYVSQPVLPALLHHVTVRRLQVGDARVDLQFTRTNRGNVEVKVLKVDGQLTVDVDKPETEFHP